MKTYHRILGALAFCVFSSAVALAQSGGTFVITQSVIPNGGGSSSGSNFEITGTVAQSVAGTTSSGAGFSIQGGFWHSSLAPTAAAVSVGGQVLTFAGGGIGNVRITLTSQNGPVRTALTNAFGYFRFDDVDAGQTYVLGIISKRFQFANSTQAVFVGDEIVDLVFTASPQ